MYYLSPSALGGDSRYAYAVGLVRTLENKLLTQHTINRLLEAGDLHTLKRELGETEYHHLLAISPDLRDFEKELHLGLNRVYTLLAAIAPEPWLINLLRLRYDFHNLKAAYKAKYYAENPSPALSDLGLLNKDLILQAVEQDDFRRLPEETAVLVSRVVAKLGSASQGTAVDIEFDKALYGFLYQEAINYKSLFLMMLFRQYIDFSNLKMWLRIKKRMGDKKLLQESVLDNGLIEKSRWLDFFDLGIGEISAKLAHTPYQKVFSEGLARYQQQETLSGLERLIDNYLLEYVRYARMVSMGHEPLIAYIWAKENEVKILRGILVGKLNDLPTEVIKERLPATYA
jgi:V/A-type H+-transporting ATPase subunit C